MQVLYQIDLGFGLRDWRMLWITEMAITNCPEACATNVGNGGDFRATLHLALEPFKALGPTPRPLLVPRSWTHPAEHAPEEWLKPSKRNPFDDHDLHFADPFEIAIADFRGPVSRESNGVIASIRSFR